MISMLKKVARFFGIQIDRNGDRKGPPSDMALPQQGVSLMKPALYFDMKVGLLFEVRRLQENSAICSRYGRTVGEVAATKAVQALGIDYIADYGVAIDAYDQSACLVYDKVLMDWRVREDFIKGE
jgi:hypothetical protein